MKLGPAEVKFLRWNLLRPEIGKEFLAQRTGMGLLPTDLDAKRSNGRILKNFQDLTFRVEQEPTTNQKFRIWEKAEILF